MSCFKDGGAVRITKKTEPPFESVTGYSPGRKAMMAVFSGPKPDLRRLAAKLHGSDDTARSWLSVTGKVLGVIAGDYTFADWKLMMDCGLVLPDIPEDRRDSTIPRLVQEASSLAEIEYACDMPVDTAGLPLIEAASAGSVDGFRGRYYRTVLGAEAMAERNPDRLCPYLRRKAGLDPFPNEAKMVGAFNCDYLLGPGLNGPDTFVAGGVVTNKGSKDGQATVTASWELLGSEPATATETVSVPAGERKKVQISRDAAGTEIDAHQAANGRCFVKVK